ncbi:MAG TPA: right-handed parallel beta-helix repeat-containing protein, partial [Methylomirabilota bacterium]
VLEAYPGESPAITEDNPNTPDGINLEGASYMLVQGFTVNNRSRAGIRSVTNHNVTIRGNTGDMNGRWGILTGFSDDLLIEDNTMTRSVAEHGIYVGNSGDRPVIRRNVVWGNNANGIHMNGDLSQGGDGIISGAIVEDNIVHDNGVAGGSGINCDGVQSSIIRNNLLYNNHASGISLYQIDGGQPSGSNQVLNNTIVMAADARWAINIQDASTGNVVRNNILYNQQSFRGSIAISADSLPGFVSDTNVIMDRFSTDGGDTRGTLAAWRSATGQDAHSIIATPATLFASFAGNDYHLSSTSPARDAGGTIANVTDDLEGAPRPQGSAFDIGAYEFPASTAPVTLTVTRSGNGTVSSAPAGISCGATCSAMFGTGTSVTLTAAPAAGAVFTGWSGSCSGTGSCTVTMATATTVGAAFAPAPVAVTVVRAGLGSGSVTSAPAGITCGTTCSATFASGGSIVLTAAPAAGSVFGGWSGGGCSGTGTCTVAPTSAATITATFGSSTTFALTATVSGAGTGTVTSAPAGLTCSTVCTATFAAGTSVALMPAAGTGSVFAGWSGACSGSGTCTVVLDRVRAVTARFSRVFTDPTLMPRSTVVRAIHFTELRGAIDTLRSRQGLSAFGWTDSGLTVGATTIKQAHLAELRAAISAVYAARGLGAPAWTDPAVTAAATVIRAVHIAELRAAVLALE